MREIQLWDATRAVHEGLVTVRELSQHTTQILRAVDEARRPVLVSRHGRIVAKITPTTLRDELGQDAPPTAVSSLRAAGNEVLVAEEEAASRKWGSAEELRRP